MFSRVFLYSPSTSVYSSTMRKPWLCSPIMLSISTTTSSPAMLNTQSKCMRACFRSSRSFTTATRVVPNHCCSSMWVIARAFVRMPSPMKHNSLPAGRKSPPSSFPGAGICPRTGISSFSRQKRIRSTSAIRCLLCSCESTTPAAVTTCWSLVKTRLVRGLNWNFEVVRGVFRTDFSRVRVGRVMMASMRSNVSIVDVVFCLYSADSKFASAAVRDVAVVS
mmetsp:Transcript_75626/g.133622  ORF Transcript_75626/g.133622 Transcript_75626/m.133622 type:complete len:221 (-) Transcript_75626:522-1184(-)